MFWTFSLAITLAASFVKLGASMVKVKFLSIGLYCAGLAVIVLLSALSLNRDSKSASI